MDSIKQPLSNAQLEILKAFSYDLNDEELKSFKNLIARFFADKAIYAANQEWDKKQLTDKDMDKLLNSKLRKSNK